MGLQRVPVESLWGPGRSKGAERKGSGRVEVPVGTHSQRASLCYDGNPVGDNAACREQPVHVVCRNPFFCASMCGRIEGLADKCAMHLYIILLLLFSLLLLLVLFLIYLLLVFAFVMLVAIFGCFMHLFV